MEGMVDEGTVGGRIVAGNVVKRKRHTILFEDFWEISKKIGVKKEWDGK